MLSTLAAFEGSRALQSSLTDTLFEFQASRVSTGQARSTPRGYISAIRATEDVRLLPECVRAIHWRLPNSGKPTPRQPYLRRCGLRLLWSRASSPQEQAVAALACLSWLLFLTVSQVLSITPAGRASDSVVPFVTIKIGGHREVRRLVYGGGRSGVRCLRTYAQACCILEGHPLFSERG